MEVILHPAYFGSIASVSKMVKASNLWFEKHDNYEKQTYRNRMDVYGANGILPLTIPVNYTQKERKLYREVKIANTYNWQSSHWKSLESAYKTSPFFEYYEDELRPLYTKPFEYLMEFNMACLESLMTCIENESDFSWTSTFQKNYSNTSIIDARQLIQRKSIKTDFKLDSYTQVFQNKHGFIKNLSVLDLLFNEGPNALDYLLTQPNEA